MPSFKLSLPQHTSLTQENPNAQFYFSLIKQTFTPNKVSFSVYTYGVNKINY